MKILRKLRGAFGTALLWSAAWLPVGAIMAVLAFLKTRNHYSNFHGSFFLQMLSFFVTTFCVWGFVSGALFALTVSITERKRSSIDALPIKRMMIWGALSALAIPVVMSFAGFPAIGAFIYAGISGIFGASLAGGTLQLARRADPMLKSTSSPQLLGPDTNLAD